MRINIKENNMEPIRKLLTYTDSNHLASICEEDVDNLLKEATMLSVSTSHGVDLNDALKGLHTELLDLDKATKAIIVIRAKNVDQLPISELAVLTRFINENLPQVYVYWGLSTRKNADAAITIIVATTH